MVILERELLNDILDSMIWSFSRLNSFYQCKRAWYYTYIMKRSSKENFFSQYGSFVHGILEKFNNGELELFELLDYYDLHYNDGITEQAPPNAYVDLGQSYYEKGRKFLENFDGYIDKTLGAEVPFGFSISVLGKDRIFKGFIDRVSRDEKGIIVTDYKSKSKFKNKEELRDYARQLYIYAYAVKEMYGEFPYKLVFDQFKEGKKQVILFNNKDFEEAKAWIIDTIEKIYKEEDFDFNKDDFFCNYLCGVGLDVCSI